MKTKKPKLLVRGATMAIRTRLYKTEDHLLWVKGYYMEEYRRFFYRDIQATVMRPMRSHTWGMIFLIVILLGIGLAFQMGGMMEASWFFYVPGLIAIARLLFVISTGGYCEFYLHTAAQHERILGVGTVFKAQKITRFIAENPETQMPG